MKVIKRPLYLNQLIEGVDTSLIKVITGIRRCGKSFLLFRLFYVYLLSNGVDENHIIRIALDDLDNEELQDARKLLVYIKSKIKDKNQYFVMLDEVQMVHEFTKLLNSLMHIDNANIYVTGSNSRFLSTDVATELRGRAYEIKMYPLSVAEYKSAYPELGFDALWSQYLRYGGLPQVAELNSSAQKADYLGSLFNTVYLRDIIERYRIDKQLEFDELMQIVASSIGAPLNPRKLSNTFNSIGQSKLSPETVSRFLSHAQDAFLIEKSMRYDVKGKRYINTLSKYYFTDLGLRNALINFRQQEESHLMENAIYNELRIRGFSVDVGQIEVYSSPKKTLEIDFVAQRGSRKYYIQSALNIDDRDKLAQETRSLLVVNDSFRKIVIVKGYFEPWHTEDGILILSLHDFMLAPNSMDM